MDSSGVVGLIGVGISAAGASVAAPIILTTGLATICGAVLYAGYRGVPQALKSAEDFVGVNIPIETLNEIDGPILKLGIVGPTQSGKTTFLNHLLQKPLTTSRTNRVYATVVALQTTPKQHIAVLDGDGYQFDQQFVVAAHADFLLVFLDHNSGGHDIARSKDRAQEHNRFISQLENHIKRKGQTARIHIILNKSDLWQKSKGAKELGTWFEAHVSNLKKLAHPGEVTSDVHSNLDATDISKVISLVSKG